MSACVYILCISPDDESQKRIFLIRTNNLIQESIFKKLVLIVKELSSNGIKNWQSSQQMVGGKAARAE